MSNDKGSKPDKPDVKPVATNRRAYHDYFVDDSFEAGIVLAGSEVKSIRDHHINIAEAHATVVNGEVWVHGMRISPYPAARDNPDPTRPRKLLLRAQEVRRLERQVREKGFTLIPLKVYFSERGLAKLQLGLCRGKRQFDKREAIAEREFEVRKQRALIEHARGQ